MPKAKLTKTFVESLELKEDGQALYTDTELKGFGLIIGRQSKTYFAQRDVRGKTVRATIGKHGVFTCEQARDKARQLIARMAAGENPNKTKKAERAEERRRLTFEQALEAYRKGRKGLSKAAHYKLDAAKRIYLADWLDTPIEEITRDMVFKRHLKIGEKHGQSTANNVMQYVRAIYNYTMQTHDDLPPNPVSALSTAKAWYKTRRRRSVIKATQLKAWYDAVIELDNSTIRDFLLLLLFTGMRRSEGLTLRWENVDFKERILTVPHTKNDEPLDLPLSDYIYDLLQRRKKKTGKNPWVFPGHGNNSHLAEPKNTMKKVTENSGVEFMLHDLRRTFVTIAESLDIPAYAIKALVNHKTGGDVTAGYIVMTVDRLREPMQKITDHILGIVNTEKAKKPVLVISRNG